MKFLFLSLILLSNLIAKDTLIVSIPPQKYFIEQIAHDNFNVKIMMDDHIFTSYYKPTAQQYIWTENATAYFKIGLDEEPQWIKTIKIINKTIKIFDTTKNIKIDSSDKHIWLDPNLVKIQAKNILNILLKLDVKNKDFYKANYFKFVNNISGLDYQLKSIFKKNKKNNFMVFNPAWGYFAKRYNLKQLEIIADIVSTKKKNAISILNQIDRYSSNILFIPTYYFPNKTLVRINKSTKIVVAPISPLEYNWENNLLNIAKLIAYQPK